MTDLLAEIFSSKVRAAVLSYMLPRPHLGFSLTDLSRRLNLPISSLQHECYKLEKNQILIARRSGNARLYRVDPRNDLCDPLTALIIKAIGPDAALRGAIDGVDGLELVFITGEGAGAEARLVVVGDLELEALDSLTARAEKALGSAPNTVEIAFFQPDDWRTRIAQHNPYVWELLTGPRQILYDMKGRDYRPL